MTDTVLVLTLDLNAYSFEDAVAPCPYPQRRPHDRAGVGGTICRICHPDPREPVVVYAPNLAWEPWPGWPGPKPHDTGPA